MNFNIKMDDKKIKVDLFKWEELNKVNAIKKEFGL